MTAGRWPHGEHRERPDSYGWVPLLPAGLMLIWAVARTIL
jgi:hypothetical protein